jgi:hypothetical protein
MTILKSDLKILYEWAKETNFPTKRAPITYGYCNKIVPHYWLKSISKTILIRKKFMTDEIFRIHQNDDILYSGYSYFDSGTILIPHKDPNIYREPYKRIQIPLRIPDREKCYMTWQGEKIYWDEGVPQVFSVMDYIHDGANLSNYPMEFLMIDVKRDTIVEL